MKKLLTLLLIIFSAFAIIVVSSCKKKESACTPPVAPILTSNSPVELYDTIILKADTTGISSFTIYWTGPNGFTAYGADIRLAPATAIMAGDYTVTVTDPKTWCVSPPSVVTVTFKSSQPCPGNETVNYSGITYNTVQLGNQCWFAQNLNVGKMVMSSSTYYSHSNATNPGIDKYCFNNDTAFCNTLGGLYDWDEMQQYSNNEGIQGICPAGWHIPKLTEWRTLLGGIKDGNILSGTKLKVGGSSGFEGILAGFRYPTGSFYTYDVNNKTGSYGDFWSSTQDNKNAWHLILYIGNAEAQIDNSDKKFGFSVRCLKD